MLGAHELQAGQRYYVILTGGNGLYRYDINDVVEVLGFHRATPKLAFVRKGREMVSVTGEKLHVNQLRSAIRAASRTTETSIVEFRLIPDEKRLHHDLLIEFAAPLPDRASLAAFLESVDGSLQDENAEYRSKRVSGRLRAPELYVMRPRWSEEICRSEFRAGRRESQHKWKAMGVGWDDPSRAAVLERVTFDRSRSASTGET